MNINFTVPQESKKIDIIQSINIVSQLFFQKAAQLGRSSSSPDLWQLFSNPQT